MTKGQDEYKGGALINLMEKNGGKNEKNGGKNDREEKGNGENIL